MIASRTDSTFRSLPRRAAWLLALMLLPEPMTASAAELTVAVAANFKATLDALAPAFEAESGHRLRSASGPTGKLYAQIVHGAPFDVFLAADGVATQRLEREGRTLPGSRFVYARGRLALYSPKRPPGDDPRAFVAAGGFRHFAIGNPKTAPYGAAAERLLQRWGLLEALRPALVHGENIGQTYQFIATGNADAGLVALASMLDPKAPVPAAQWRVLPADDVAMDQEAVILKRTAAPDAARAFVAFLRSAAARQRIEASGYALP